MATEVTSTVINGVTYKDTKVDGVLVSSEWTDANGKGTVTRTEANGTITEVGTWTNTGSTSVDVSYEYHYNSSWVFQGGTKKEKGVTYTLDANWNVTAKQVDSSSLPQLAEADGAAYKLFGAAFYKTQTWSDPNNGNNGSNTTYFDAQGNKLGTGNKNTNSWKDPQNVTVTSTNENYQDANGQMLGSKWSDTNGNSGWNTRRVETVTKELAGLDFDGDSAAGEAAVSVQLLVERGSNTWTKPGSTTPQTSTMEHYFKVDPGNSNAWIHLGGKEERDDTITIWDKDWKVLSQKTSIAAGTPKLTNTGDMVTAYRLYVNESRPDVYYKTETWSDANNNGNSGSNTTYFDAAGNKLGMSNKNTNTWTNPQKVTVTSTNESYQDANWNMLESRWSDTSGNSGWNTRKLETVTKELAGLDFDGNGAKGEAVVNVQLTVERGSNTWTNPTTNKAETFTFERYYKVEANNTWTHLGGKEVRDGTTTIWDKDWKMVSQQTTIDTNSMPKLKATDGAAYELFGEAFYKTQTWSDPNNGNNGSNTTYFDAQGNKLGTGNKNTNSWKDPQNVTVTSTNENYQDANGQMLGSKWSDTNGNSGWNTRRVETVTKELAGLDFDGDSAAGEAAVSVQLLVERGSNTWTKPGSTTPQTSTMEHYFKVEANNTFTHLGGKEERDDTITIWDKDWKVLSQKTSIAAGTPKLTNTGDMVTAYRLYVNESRPDVYYKTETWSDANNNGNSGSNTTYFDAAGNKLGMSNKNTNTWTNPQKVTVTSTNESYQDANWNMLESRWSDTSGNSGWNTRKLETVTKELAGLDFDGNGAKGEAVVNVQLTVERGSNTWTNPTTNKAETFTFERYYKVEANNTWTHLGGKEVRDGTTTIWDKDWKMVSQQTTIDTNSMPKLKATDGAAYELFGEAFYKTQTWSDPNNGNNGSNTTYFDAQGNKLGTGNKNTNSWKDPQNVTVTSTNENYQDANGQMLGSKWSDTNGNSGWNTRRVETVTKELAGLDFDGDSAAGEAAVSVQLLVERGSNTWTKPGSTTPQTSTMEHYFKVEANNTFTHLGGKEERDDTITIWDKDWKVLSQKTSIAAGTPKLTNTGDMVTAYRLYVNESRPDVYYKTETWSDANNNGNSGSNTTYFDAAGNKLGMSNKNTNTWTNPQKVTVTSTNESYQDANWNMLESRWSDTSGNSGWNTRKLETVTKELAGLDFDGNGAKGEAVVNVQLTVERGSNTWTNPTTNKAETFTFERYYKVEANNTWTHLGGKEVRDGTTTIWDKDWKMVSQQTTIDTNSMSKLSAADGAAYELFGAAFYKTQTWSDPNNGNNGSNTTYFDAQGNKLGTGNKNTNSWKDPQNVTVTSTNENYQDANGQMLGSKWSDTNGNSGWNTRRVETVTKELAGLDFDGDSAAGEAAVSVQLLVERGSNTWTKPGSTTPQTSTMEHYFKVEANNTFTHLGGKEERDDTITIWDKDWKVLSQKTSIAAGTPKLTNTGDMVTAYRLYVNESRPDVYYKTETWSDANNNGNSGSNTTYFDAAGNKLGMSNKNTNTWTNPQKVTVTSTNESYQDANWNMLESRWSDTSGNSGWNTRKLETVTKELAGLDFDGNGAKGEAVVNVQLTVERGSNTWTNPTTNKAETFTFERYYKVEANNTWTHLGGKEVRDGTTTIWDKDWKMVSQQTTIDTNSMPKLKATDGAAYELFGEAFYKTQTWSDPNNGNNGSNTTYFDAQGNKLGTGNKNTNSWKDPQNVTVTSTNENYQDANGQMLGSKWSDTNGNSGWNTRRVETVTKELAGLDFDGDSAAGEAAVSVQLLVERGSNTWTKPGSTTPQTSTMEHYFKVDPGNSNAWIHLGGKEERDDTITIWDKDWKVLSQKTSIAAGTPKLTNTGDMVTAYRLYVNESRPDVYYKTETWSDANNNGNSGSNTTYFDAAGNKLGMSNKNTNTWTNPQKVTVTSTNESYQDANWNMLESRWSDTSGNSGWNTRKLETVTKELAGLDFDGNGAKGEAVVNVQLTVERGSNTWTNPTTNKAETFTFERYYKVEANNTWTHLGGKEVRDGTTTIWDKDWKMVSQQTTIDTNSMPKLKATDGAAYELFGEAFYKTQTWSDPNNGNNGSNTTYFDAQGNKLGTGNKNTNSWKDPQNVTVTSTNENYQDANGQMLGSKWSDTNGNSGWNTRRVETVTKELAGLDFDGDSAAGEAAVSVQLLVERGSNTWTKPGSTTPQTSTMEHYFKVEANNTFTHLGGKEERDDTITIWDKDWKVLSQKTSIAAGTPKLTNTGDMVTAYRLYVNESRPDVYYKTETWSDANNNGNSGSNTTYFDAAGNKLGMSNKNTNTWTNPQKVTVTSTNESYQDASGSMLGSTWSDGNGSGSNFRTRETVTDFDFNGDKTVNAQDSRLVIVERNQSKDASGKTIMNMVNYFTIDTTQNNNPTAMGSFLGGIETNGSTTTVYDANHKAVSQTVDMTALVPVWNAAGALSGYLSNQGPGTVEVQQFSITPQAGQSYTLTLPNGKVLGTGALTQDHASVASVVTKLTSLSDYTLSESLVGLTAGTGTDAGKLLLTYKLQGDMAPAALKVSSAGVESSVSIVSLDGTGMLVNFDAAANKTGGTMYNFWVDQNNPKNFNVNRSTFDKDNMPITNTWFSADNKASNTRSLRTDVDHDFNPKTAPVTAIVQTNFNQDAFGLNWNYSENYFEVDNTVPGGMGKTISSKNFSYNYNNAGDSKVNMNYQGGQWNNWQQITPDSAYVETSMPTVTSIPAKLTKSMTGFGNQSGTAVNQASIKINLHEFVLPGGPLDGMTVISNANFTTRNQGQDLYVRVDKDWMNDFAVEDYVLVKLVGYNGGIDASNFDLT